MGYAHDYASAIMHRGRVPMEPVDFVPDWADRPRKTKFYPGVESFPLLDTGFPATATVAAGCLPAARREPGPFTLDALSGMLRDSYGLTGRRLGVQANTDLAALPHYPQANWSRGTASGGGLYPVSVYWVSGPGGPLVPGVHYYSAPHHAMQRLLAGDVTAQVRAALGGTVPGADHDQFLVLGIKYWQNAFKYNSFSFHAVSMDLGALVQTWRIWAHSRGLALEPALWFEERRLSHLLGVDDEEEGIFAVVPLAWESAGPAAGHTAKEPAGGSRGGGSAAGPRSDPPAPAPAPPAPGPAVRHTDSERSRTVLRFETLRRIHDATARDAADRPAPGALEQAAAVARAATGTPVPLPEPALPPVTVRTALRERRSSFGRFDASRPVTPTQLAAMLSACARVSLGGDAEPSAGAGGPDGPRAPRLLTLYAFVNHVEGVAPGAYAYDPDTGALGPVVPGAPGPFLQRNYFLSNYNLEQAGVVVVPTIRVDAVLDAVGDRGYRLVNATVGAVAQTFYTTAAALGLGAGVALGFDNISYIEELGLDATGEKPLLIMLLGHERPDPADFRYEIV
ncbi:SagB/ThcOx family dehydrogenase [Streptomyces sp. NPDC001780]